MGWLVLADGDPSLGAEPGFHDEAPSGVQVVAGPLGHTLDILPVLVEIFTKNRFPGGGAQAAVGIMLELAGRQPAEAAQAAMIELMGDQLDLEHKRCSFQERDGLARIQGVFQIAHAAFHRAIVLRIGETPG